MLLCIPGDIIIKEGTIGTKMYFIQEGIVDIVMASGDVATRFENIIYYGIVIINKGVILDSGCLMDLN